MHRALLSFVVALGFIAAVGRSFGTRNDHERSLPKPLDNYGGGPVGGELVCVNKADRREPSRKVTPRPQAPCENPYAIPSHDEKHPVTTLKDRRAIIRKWL